jgi:hypothetical protein
MGTYFDGILGNFKGKIGSVVGSKWRGIHYMRSKGTPRSGNYSDKQLSQQSRFALATHFIQPLHPVLKVGYRNQARNRTAINMALSDVLRDVIIGEYPNWDINYQGLRISKGTLTPAYNPTVTMANGQITFHWEAQGDQGGGKATDQALLVAMAENGAVSFSILQYSRSMLSGVLMMPFMAGQSPVHCYIGMVSAEGREASNSFYAGFITNTPPVL